MNIQQQMMLDPTAGSLARTLGGYQIIQSDHATKTTYHFPPSKHRSKRIFKKLLQRHGAQYTNEPGCYMFGDRIVVHPFLYGKLMESFSA